MVDDKTRLYSFKKVRNSKVRDILSDVVEALDERGYNPTSQIVGYLISGDPGYISNNKNARARITSIDRNKIIEELLNSYLEEKWDI